MSRHFYYIRITLLMLCLPLRIYAQQCSEYLENLSYKLNDAAWVSGETFISIGDGGKILRTKDAGLSWTEINSGTLSSFIKIQFVTDSIGYILGANDLMLKTEDAGNHWFNLSPIGSAYPYCSGLYFSSPDTGFVCAGYGKIFRTIDAGRSWKKVNDNSSDDLYSIAFLNKSTGFACGSSNRLLKTTDYGNTWKSVDMSSYGYNLNFIKVVFVDENIGYLLARTGVVIKTTDGGTSWTKVGTASTDFAVTMNFINKNIGYVVGGWTSSALLRTMNGGLTWQSADYSYGGSLSGIAQNRAGNKGVVVGDGAGYGYTSEPGKVILYYDEQANNWKHSCYLNGSAYFWDVNFPDKNTGYLFGDYYGSSGIAFKTLDGGTTWNPLSFRPAGAFGHSFFLNKDSAYVSSDSIYFTSDGGNHWRSVFNKTGKLYFNKNTGFVLGFTDLYRTGNAGKTWVKVLSASSYFLDFAFPDAATGYAVGNNCAYKSIDSGKVWTPYTNLPTNFYRSINFENRDSGYVGGENGLLFKTIDGGKNWTPITTNIMSGFGINKIIFKNQNEGYILASSNASANVLFTTHNGGTSWQYNSQFEELHCMYLKDDGEIYFSGERGAFGRTAKGKSPSMAGYILGDQSVIKNTSCTYSIMEQFGTSYNWTVSDNIPFENQNNGINVTFKDKGVFIISVTPSNACGTGFSRKLKVTVSDSLRTGIDDISTKNIKVFPNPVRDYLTIALSDNINDNLNLAIYDFHGNMVRKIKYKGVCEDGIRINLSDLKKGIYLLEIFHNNIFSTFKMIKL